MVSLYQCKKIDELRNLGWLGLSTSPNYHPDMPIGGPTYMIDPKTQKVYIVKADASVEEMIPSSRIV